MLSFLLKLIFAESETLQFTIWAPFWKSFLTWALFKVTEVYVSRSFLHEKRLTESGLTHFAVKFTQTLSGLWSSICIFRNEKWNSVVFFGKSSDFSFTHLLFAVCSAATLNGGAQPLSLSELLVSSHAQPPRAVTHQDVCSLNSHSRFGPQA